MSAPILPTSTVVWADSGRQALFEQWLSSLTQQHALRPQSLRAASADASFRRYLRIDTDSGHSLIVMDAPPDKKTASLLCRCRP